MSQVSVIPAKDKISILFAHAAYQMGDGLCPARPAYLSAKSAPQRT